MVNKHISCQLTTGGHARIMTRPRHSKKEVEEAIRYAEQNNWRVEVGGSHAWGKMYCPINDKDCRCGEFCITSINSTPRNAVTHAKQIRRVVDKCKHQKSTREEG